MLNVRGVEVQLSRNWKVSYDWLTASEWKWSLRSADVRGEEHVTSLRTSVWEARFFWAFFFKTSRFACDRGWKVCGVSLNFRLLCISVVGMTLVFQLRFSLRGTTFAWGLEQDFHSQSFAMPWIVCYQASHLQEGRCNTWKENMLNKCSKQDFIKISVLFIMALILKCSQEFFPNFSFS